MRTYKGDLEPASPIFVVPPPLSITNTLLLVCAIPPCLVTLRDGVMRDGLVLRDSLVMRNSLVMRVLRDGVMRTSLVMRMLRDGVMRGSSLRAFRSKGDTQAQQGTVQ